MISTANITMQFGEKPLFENISVKFQAGNRYGLIGANGCGKSTLMKILTGELKPTHGSVLVGEGQRLGVLSQDQFAFEKYRVVDTVIMGHKELWKIKKERDRIYGLPEMKNQKASWRDRSDFQLRNIFSLIALIFFIMRFVTINKIKALLNINKYAKS